jgi:hypothetical protein
MEDDESSNDEQPAKNKRKYTKDMNNPRWKNNKNKAITDINNISSTPNQW